MLTDLKQAVGMPQVVYWKSGAIVDLRRPLSQVPQIIHYTSLHRAARNQASSCISSEVTIINGFAVRG